MMNYPYSKVIFVLLMIARFLYASVFSSMLVLALFSVVFLDPVLGGAVSELPDPAILLPVLAGVYLVLALVPILLPLWLKSTHPSPSVATSHKSKVVEALDFATMRSFNFRKRLRIFEFDDKKIHLGLLLVGPIGFVVIVSGLALVSLFSSNLDLWGLFVALALYFLFLVPYDGDRIVAPDVPSPNTAKALSIF